MPPEREKKMTKAQRIIKYIKREATELGLSFDVKENLKSYSIDMRADDAKLYIIMGSRGGIKFVSWIDPLHTVGSYSGREASYFHIGYFFGAVKRQREMLAKRFEEECKSFTEEVA